MKNKDERCEQFSKWLQKAMDAKGWHQSELARRAELPRDSISVYVRARSFPSSRNLKRLLDLFGATISDVFPDGYGGNASPSVDFGADNVFEFSEIKDNPGRARIKMNRILSLATAAKIVELVDKDALQSS